MYRRKHTLSLTSTHGTVLFVFRSPTVNKN